MLKFVQLTILSFLIQTGFAQTDPTISQLEFTTYFFSNTIYQFDKIENIVQLKNGEGYRFGLLYSKKIARNIWVSSGLNYFRATNEYFGPNIDTTYGNFIYTVGSRIMQIPVKARYDVFKWFYFRTGISLDYQISNREGTYIHNQSGISYSLSCGLDLKIKEQIHLQVEPEIGFTSLPSLYSEDYQQHFTLSGLTFILGFRF